MSVPIFGKCRNQLKNTRVYFSLLHRFCLLDILIEMSNFSNFNYCVSFPRASSHMFGKCFNQLKNLFGLQIFPYCTGLLACLNLFIILYVC